MNFHLLSSLPSLSSVDDSCLIFYRKTGNYWAGILSSLLFPFPVAIWSLSLFLDQFLSFCLNRTFCVNTSNLSLSSSFSSSSFLSALRHLQISHLLQILTFPLVFAVLTIKIFYVLWNTAIFYIILSSFQSWTCQTDF